jgi:hypothetical protein
MGRMLILADDLSGGSDCAIASITSGLTATVALGDLPHDLPAHVILIDCNTRHLGPVTAADKTIHLLHRYHPSPDCLLFTKLDSSLRGNVAAELTAVLAFRRSASARFNNPNFRAHLTGKVESTLSQYPTEVDGYIWGCERMGPLDNLIGGGWSITGIACFCPFCLAKARERGISAERARQGYIKLDQFFHAATQPQRPPDGFFVVFLRTLFQYPEILSWNTLWYDSYHEVRSELYGTAKSIAPAKPFGFHVMQNVTFSPFYSASEDYAKLAQYADFLKIATYSNAAGPRLAHFIDHLSTTIFADATPADLQPLFYKMMGYHEASFDQIVTGGLSPAYVANETRRAIEDTRGTVQIYPGIDIDVPTSPGEKHTAPDDVRAATKAAFGAWANGVVLSREYYEMQLANLSAAGETIRQIVRA